MCNFVRFYVCKVWGDFFVFYGCKYCREFAGVVVDSVDLTIFCELWECSIICVEFWIFQQVRECEFPHEFLLFLIGRVVCRYRFFAGDVFLKIGGLWIRCRVCPQVYQHVVDNFFFGGLYGVGEVLVLYPLAFMCISA